MEKETKEIKELLKGSDESLVCALGRGCTLTT